MSKTFDFNVLNETSNTLTMESMSRNLDYMGGKSYFSETIDFLIEYNREYTEATKTLYRSILESGDNIELINEGFTEFGAAVKKIIDKFLAFIKSLFQRFITNLNSMFKAEGYLKKHEKDFSKFSEQHEFEYMGYNFTIQPDIPLTDAESEWIGDLNNGKGVDLNFEHIGAEFQVAANDPENRSNGQLDQKKINDLVLKNIKGRYENLLDYLRDEYYDKLRAKIIGKDGDSISESDFANELFCIFRDDSSDKESIEINSSYITETLTRFKGYEKAKKIVEKNKKEIDKSYSNIKKDLDSMISIKGTGDARTMDLGITSTHSNIAAAGNYGSASLTNVQMSQDIINVLELYKKAKVNQVQQMSNIHALAFSAKLDAMKDLFNQDKAILYKALYKIQGVPKKD